MACFVLHCKNVRRLLSPNELVTFHRFPQEKDMYKKWMQAINKDAENIPWNKYHFICSNHFKSSDFKPDSLRRLLTETAVPSLHIQNTKFTVSSKPGPSSAVQPSTNKLEETCEKRNTSKIQREVSGVSGDSTSDSNTTKRSSSSSAGAKRKKIKLDHNYATSPRRQAVHLKTLQHKYAKQTWKLYQCQQKEKRLKKKINTLKTVVEDLRSKFSLPSDLLSHLETTFSSIPQALMSRMLKNVRTGLVSRSRYPQELRKFAITLQFLSAKAYEYVRRTFNLALPHQSVIRKWSSTVECVPGFSTVCFDVLKSKVKEAADKGLVLICSVLIDEMSIKKQIDFDGKRCWGYVDIGIDLNDDAVEPAQEAFVIMVVCLNASWKLPVAYFLIKSLSASDKANIINETLIRLHETGVEISSITCDGPSAHFSMFRELGCNFNHVDKLKTYFKHPSGSQNVYAVFDACHMLKLIRNALAVLGVLVDGDNNKIEWAYIQKLYDIQEKETLSLANKLGKKHMEWQRHKMKVNLAAQTLSNSVAEALLFLKDDLKHKYFLNCIATVNFIKKIYKIFDILNSRLPWAQGDKAPLKPEMEHEWRPFLENALDYILNLKDIHGIFLWRTSRKTPVLGFAISITSVLGIYDNLVKKNKLKYLLTYKLSKDHLELFFCAIRSRNGWNNNPSALQFARSYKKLLLQADVSSGEGNCKVLDATSILSVSSAVRSERFSIEVNDLPSKLFFLICEKVRLVDITEFCEAVVTYISGYVFKMLQKLLHCDTCLDLLSRNDNNDHDSYLLIKRRDRGIYLYPSKDLLTVCQETEKYIRKLMYLNNNSLPSADLVVNIILSVCGKLMKLGRMIFSTHSTHRFTLTKLIISCYCKIRLHNLAQKYTVSLQGNRVRQKFNKLILFLHQ